MELFLSNRVKCCTIILLPLYPRSLLIKLLCSRLLRSKHKIFRSTVQVEGHQASVMAECTKCQPLLP